VVLIVIAAGSRSQEIIAERPKTASHIEDNVIAAHIQVYAGGIAPIRAAQIEGERFNKSLPRLFGGEVGACLCGLGKDIPKFFAVLLIAHGSRDRPSGTIETEIHERTLSHHG
jgi:hypothetical protein